MITRYPSTLITRHPRGLVEKWPSGLEDVLTRVPLLVRTPGGAKGHVVAEPVQLFDIVPTFLDLAGINLGLDPTHVAVKAPSRDGLRSLNKADCGPSAVSNSPIGR